MTGAMSGTMSGMQGPEAPPLHANDTGLPAPADIASVIEDPWLGGDHYRPPSPDFALVLTRYFVADWGQVIRKVSLPAPPLTGRLVLTDGTELAWTAFLGGLIKIEAAGGAWVCLLPEPLTAGC